jgi:hypothetical protein
VGVGHPAPEVGTGVEAVGIGGETDPARNRVVDLPAFMLA